MTQTATKREVKQTLEEVLEAANELRSQGMTGIVMVLDDGRYEILWAPAKLYVDTDGVARMDQVWIDNSGELVAVQDMNLQQLHDLAREAISVRQGQYDTEVALAQLTDNPNAFIISGNTTMH